MVTERRDTRRGIARMPVFCAATVLLVGLAGAQALLPDRAFSALENRALEPLPHLSVQAVLSGRFMQAAETYVADQFPARDAWVSAQALWDWALLRNERGGILLGRAGWLFERLAANETRTAGQNIDALVRMQAAVGRPIALALVPTSAAVYPEYLPRFAAAEDQAGLLEGLYARAEGLGTVDILGALHGRKGDIPLFLRTDHHWTDAGAEAAKAALLEAWGRTPTPMAVTEINMGVTFGSYFARAPSPLIRGDAFRVAWPEDIRLSLDGEPGQALPDPEAAKAARDKYAQLLGGNHGRLTLTGGAGEGTLLVIKDSFANLLAPKLMDSFARIELVDLRYFPGNLMETIAETEADEILCLYGLTTFLTDRNLLLHAPL